jgi:type I restriction enzyme S subunit
MKYGPLSSDEQEKLKLNVGDALLIRSNGSASIVGKTALITKEVTHCAFAGYLVRIRLSDLLILPAYFQLVMKTPHVRESIETPIRTTSGVKNINTTEISNLLIPLPPLAVQYAIVEKLSGLLSVCDVLTERIAEVSKVQQAFAEEIIEWTYA